MTVRSCACSRAAAITAGLLNCAAPDPGTAEPTTVAATTPPKELIKPLPTLAGDLVLLV
jgi:hypothetical protein